MNRQYNYKKIVIILVLLFVAFPSIRWFAGHAYVEIDTSTINGEYSYSITNAAGKVTEEKTSNAKHFKKLVKKGNYQAVVKQDNKSFVAFFKTGGFLSTSKNTARLENEAGRMFVGDNPGQCMLYVNDKLHSGSCAGNYYDIKTHMPASNDTPTYALRDNAVKGTFEGFTYVAGEGYMLLRQSISEDDTMMHVLYKTVVVNGKASTVTRVMLLPQLNPDKTYAVLGTGGSFVFYESSLNKVYTLKSLNDQPVLIDISSGDKTLISPSNSIRNNGDSLYALYTNLQGEGKNAKKKPMSEIVTYKDGSKKSFRFSKIFNSAVGCGKDLLCLSTGDIVGVYDISSKTPELLYEIRGVRDIQTINDSVFVATSSGIVRLNTVNKTGSYVFSYGDYSFNSMQLQNSQVLLSLTDSSKRKVALLVDLSNSSPDFIDKKINELKRVNEVESVSAYRKIVFVTPKTGEPIYNIDSGFAPDPQIVKSANSSINSAVQKIGFEGYTIISTNK